MILAAPFLTGCATTSQVRSIAADAGIQARYYASTAEVIGVLPNALRHVKHRIVEEGLFDSTTSMVIGSRGMALWQNGEFSRILVREHPLGESQVHSVSRSRFLLDLSGRANRTAPRLIQALDAALGSDRIAVVEGMRVRGRVSDDPSAVVEGFVSNIDGDLALQLALPDQRRILPMASLNDVSVLRGSYHHGAEGAIVGTIIGLALGYAVYTNCEGFSECVWTFSLVPAAGTLAGWLVGLGARSELWSQVSLRSERF